MPSILNGLFAGRAGINSFGIAIGVLGDNISNSNTVGFKAARAEFADLLAGKSSKTAIGVGSEIIRTTQIFEQGTLELTGRDLDTAIDGNGFFIVSDVNDSKFYTRAGNFKVSSDGLLVTQEGLKVLGFPLNGSGALEELNLNTVSQDNVVTEELTIAGNVDARATKLTNGVADIPTVSVAGVATASTTTYADLNDVAEYSTAVEVFDSQGGKHTVTFFFFKTDDNEYTVRAYANSDDVDATGTASGLPRLLVNSSSSGNITLAFNSDGTRTSPPAAGTFDISLLAPWNNGSTSTGTIGVSLDPFTQYSSSATISSITQDGQGVGNITSVSIGENGTVSSILDNGQEAVIGTIALANFANSEALTRLGGQLLQKSTNSGEPVVGTPSTGTFGVLAAETLELSTVDIADQFVKLITLQRGFQANSRIIGTINQLLAELIQLA